MPEEISSDIFFEPQKKKKSVVEELKRMNRTALLFISNNPTILFVRQFNAEKQAMMELVFSEAMVENPEKRKAKLRTYIC